MRSKCNLYENNEKSSKYFLNLEKKKGESNIVKKLVKNNIDIVDQKGILNEIHDFYSSLFCRKISKSEEECLTFLNSLQIPIVSLQHKNDCEKPLTVEDLEKSLFCMSVGKSPGNDGLSVEFYKFFWPEIKDTFFDSVCYSRIVGELSISQRQAIIKLLEKRDKDKRFIENWRPISLLNVDTKIISKSLASRFCSVLPTIVSADQTAYVKGRYIGESIRLISDILDSSVKYNIPGYILTVDLEKAFDSIDHVFLIAVLKKFGFGENFISWISILLNKNESCVSNGGHTTQYFRLNRGARQGDPIAAYLFILVLEIFFIMIRSNDSINPLCILDFVFLLSAYADDTTFFISDLDSVQEIFITFDGFSKFSGMNINKSKCELAGIGVKNSVLTALQGVKNVSLLDSCIRVLGVNFTYNTILFIEKNYVDCIKKIQNVLRVWGMRFLTLYGKITIFKSLAFSKLIYIACMSTATDDIINLLETIHIEFIWDNKRPNVKHLTLIGDYCYGGLKDVDILSKFKSLHLNWLTRLFDGNFHPWKNIPLYYLNKISRKFDLFHPNLLVSSNMLSNMPVFYHNIINFWQEISYSPPTNVSMIIAQSVCFNAFIRVDSKPIAPSLFNIDGPIYVSDLFLDNGSFISWEQASTKFGLNNYLKWFQIISAIPPDWKTAVKNSACNLISAYRGQHLNKGGKIIPLGTLNSKLYYTLFIDKISKRPTSEKYFFRLFGPDLKWDKVYMLPYTITVDSVTRNLQFKLSFILFLKARLFHINYATDSLCSLCNLENETPIHFFCECSTTVSLWNNLKAFFIPVFDIGVLTPRSALFGFFIENDSFHIIRNHILLLFKLCIYQNRLDVINVYTIISKIKKHIK